MEHSSHLTTGRSQDGQAKAHRNGIFDYGESSVGYSEFLTPSGP